MMLSGAKVILARVQPPGKESNLIKSNLFKLFKQLET